jgi:outer membrane murein-binding lipoprotein Lpp
MTVMRRIRVAAMAVTVGALVLAGCGSGGDLATDENGRTVVTAPATKARTIVSEQNQQLQQMEQQTSQADPTAP